LFQLQFWSSAIIIGNFELHFKQRDESGVNAAALRMRCKMSLSMESIANRAFVTFGEGALTVTIETGVTMRSVGRIAWPRKPNTNGMRVNCGNCSDILKAN